MLKTYRIIPLVFILFLFGFTLSTVSPVFAQGQWDPSMGMRHPDRPCMIVNSCGVDRRSSAQIANDPYDTNNPVSQEARANQADSPEQVSTSPSGGEVAQSNVMKNEFESLRTPGKAGRGPSPARCADGNVVAANIMLQKALENAIRDRDHWKAEIAGLEARLAQINDQRRAVLRDLCGRNVECKRKRVRGWTQ